jgi:hypothetical protein
MLLKLITQAALNNKAQHTTIAPPITSVYDILRNTLPLGDFGGGALNPALR